MRLKLTPKIAEEIASSAGTTQHEDPSLLFLLVTEGFAAYEHFCEDEREERKRILASDKAMDKARGFSKGPVKHGFEA